MTVSERAFPRNLREKLAERKLPEETPEKPSDTGDVARRLISYMVEADQRRFLIALVVRLVGDSVAESPAVTRAARKAHKKAVQDEQAEFLDRAERVAPDARLLAQTQTVLNAVFLDVDAGRVVKGVKFVDIRDAGDPVERACAYEAQGADDEAAGGLLHLGLDVEKGLVEAVTEIGPQCAGRAVGPLQPHGGVHRRAVFALGLAAHLEGGGLAQHRWAQRHLGHVEALEADGQGQLRPVRRAGVARLGGRRLGQALQAHGVGL